MNPVDFKTKMEQAVLAALDTVVEQEYGIQRQGWRDEDLQNIVPWINKHAERIERRYNTAYGVPA